MNAALIPVIYMAAAVAEIAGCFAFWAWLRLDKSILWVVPGVASLVVFAYLLTLVDGAAMDQAGVSPSFAGRTFAAYGGVYIASSLVWMYAVEGMRPDRWDMIGAVLCLVGASVILIGPRG